jgi:hypothetical protein
MADPRVANIEISEEFNAVLLQLANGPIATTEA